MTFEKLISENKNIIVMCPTYRDAKYQIDNLVTKKKDLIYKVSRVSNRVEMKNRTVITFIAETLPQTFLGISNDIPIFLRAHFQPLVDGFDEDLVKVRREYYE